MTEGPTKIRHDIRYFAPDDYTPLVYKVAWCMNNAVEFWERMHKTTVADMLNEKYVNFEAQRHDFFKAVMDDARRFIDWCGPNETNLKTKDYKSTTLEAYKSYKVEKDVVSMTSYH